MEKLTEIEKKEIAFLIRQEINEGEKLIKELIPTITETDKGIFNQMVEGYQIRKRRFKEIARKLEIEL